MWRLSKYTVLLAVGAFAACAGDPVRPDDSAPVVLSVSPANDETGVNIAAPVVVTFSHAMLQGVEMNVVLHEESISGPTVAGTVTWSNDRRTLSFKPAAPLKTATTYVLHLAPTLTAASGRTVDHDACAALGGRSVTSGIMSGGMPASGMMGDGWQMRDGSYGMIFSFTTA